MHSASHYRTAFREGDVAAVSLCFCLLFCLDCLQTFCFCFPWQCFIYTKCWHCTPCHLLLLLDVGERKNPVMSKSMWWFSIAVASVWRLGLEWDLCAGTDELQRCSCAPQALQPTSDNSSATLTPGQRCTPLTHSACDLEQNTPTERKERLAANLTTAA